MLVIKPCVFCGCPNNFEASRGQQYVFFFVSSEIQNNNISVFCTDQKNCFERCVLFCRSARSPRWISRCGPIPGDQDFTHEPSLYGKKFDQRPGPIKIKNLESSTIINHKNNNNQKSGANTSATFKNPSFHRLLRLISGLGRGCSSGTRPPSPLWIPLESARSARTCGLQDTVVVVVVWFRCLFS